MTITTTFGAIGADDRHQPHELRPCDPVHRIALDCVHGVCFLSESPLVAGKHRKLRAHWSSIRGARWPSEPEISEQHGRTGFLLTEDLVLTAGHNLPRTGVRLAATFGLRQPNITLVASRDACDYLVPQDQVFEVSDIVAIETSPARGDFALLRLCKPVPESLARPQLLGSCAHRQRGDPLFMIGHPRAQPLKIVVRPTRARVGPAFDALDGAYFTSTVDAFRHSSGSPIHDSAGLVIGIQVGGSRDYGSEDRPHREEEGIPVSRATRIDALASVLNSHGIPIQKPHFVR